MRKVLFLVPLLAGLAQHSFAQYDDAASLSTRCMNTFSEDPVYGSARYSAMGGANLATGHDVSTIKLNPAGLGLYTEEVEFSLTPRWHNTNGDHGMSIASGGGVFTVDHRHRAQGYTASVVGFSYHERNNYNSLYSSKNKTYDEHGKTAEWSAAYAANFGNRQFYGFGVNIITGKTYKQTDMAENHPLDIKNALTGFNVNAGAVFNLKENINVALALQSPSRINIEETNKINREDETQSKPYNSLEYHIITPMQVAAGFASDINYFTKINADYQFQNYRSMKVASSYDLYDDVKAFTKECMNPCHTFKVGLEITPFDDFKVRLGASYKTALTNRPSERFLKEFAEQYTFPVQNTYPVLMPHESIFLCAGLGYKINAFFFDVAYVFNKQDYSFYPRTSPGNSYTEKEQFTNNVLLTLGVRM